ncbi:MAG: porin family protein [Bacteroidota bacterium]
MRTFLCFLVVVAPALAQPSVGVKAGLNVANLVYDDGDGFDFDPGARLGIVGGLTVDVPVSPVLGVRIEALYAQKGWRDETWVLVGPIDNPAEVDGTITLELDYLEVPVLANVSVPTGSALEIGVQAGVAPAFILRDGIGCSGFESDGFDVCAESDDDDVDFESFDLGAVIGATVGSGPFAVDLRYTHGLSNLADDEITSSDFSIRNRVFSITGVYRFGR